MIRVWTNLTSRCTQLFHSPCQWKYTNRKNDKYSITRNHPADNSAARFFCYHLFCSPFVWVLHCLHVQWVWLSSTQGINTHRTGTESHRVVIRAETVFEWTFRLIVLDLLHSHESVVITFDIRCATKHQNFLHKHSVFPLEQVKFRFLPQLSSLLFNSREYLSIHQLISTW